MGQYLAIGLRINAAVRKEDVEKHREEGRSADDILSLLEARYRLADIYERREKDDYYVYSLKRDLLDKEYVPFIEKFYALRYPGDEKLDSAAAAKELKGRADTCSRLALLEKKRFQTYQKGYDVDYFHPDKWCPGSICFHSYNAILSIDGKIIMECYADLFDFIRRSTAAQMPEFELAKALTVWIDGC